jgi:uncharacterized membrane protein YkoI
MIARRSLLAGLALTFFSWPAVAQDQQGGCLPLKRVIKAVQRQFGGRVLDASLFDSGGGGVYRIRLLTADGQVVDVVADCASGQVVDVRGGG